MFGRSKSFSLPAAQDNAYRDYQDLIPLRSKADVEKFLQAILTPFLDSAHIHESGLLDKLIACDVVSFKDNESLDPRNRPKRRDCARYLWRHFLKIDHKIFIKKALPVLCETYGFIIPKEFWKTKGVHTTPAEHHPEDDTDNQDNKSDLYYCLRCAIQERIRHPDLAQFLCENKLVDVQTYSNFTKDDRAPASELVWDQMFEVFKNTRRPTVENLEEEMAKLLTEHSLRVPEDLVEEMAQGFRCLCMSEKRRKTIGVLTAKRLRRFLSEDSNRRPSQVTISSTVSSSSSVFPPSYYSSDTHSLSETVSYRSDQTIREKQAYSQQLQQDTPPETQVIESHNSADFDTGFCEGGYDTVKHMPKSGESTLRHSGGRGKGRGLIQTWSGRGSQAVWKRRQKWQGAALPSPKCRPSLLDALRGGLFGQVLSKEGDSVPATSAPGFSSEGAVGENKVKENEPNSEADASLHSFHEEVETSERIEETLSEKVTGSLVLQSQTGEYQGQSESVLSESQDSYDSEAEEKISEEATGSLMLRSEPGKYQCRHNQSESQDSHASKAGSETPQCFSADEDAEGETRGGEMVQDLTLCDLENENEDIQRRNELDELQQFVASAVPTTHALSALLRNKAPGTLVKLQGLVHTCDQVEKEYDGIRQRLAELQKVPEVPGSCERLVLLQKGDIINKLCKELLDRAKMFIVCVVLNHITAIGTEQTREEAYLAASHTLTLIEDNMSELNQVLPDSTELQEDTTAYKQLEALILKIQEFLGKF